VNLLDDDDEDEDGSKKRVNEVMIKETKTFIHV